MESIDLVAMTKELERLRKELKEKKEFIHELTLTNKKLITDCKLLKLTLRAATKGETQLLLYKSETTKIEESGPSKEPLPQPPSFNLQSIICITISIFFLGILISIGSMFLIVSLNKVY
ncbi:unnamed protein product [Blepharisma stoltei]|uniref:Uncharacterized protein n=1 Tax=Blepharisma stoltei TaxID=1481888 RepID=A0AAU9IXJ4_9CILI|nr:unnamed protein product [Blepharisma stoltei]